MRDALDASKPRPSMLISEWADQYRFLSPGVAAEHGKYRVSRTPYVREPMDIFLDLDVWKVVLMWGSQTSKTDGVLNNVLGYHIHLDPCPIMMGYPRDKDAEKFSKKRVAPMIRDTPVLAELVSSPRSRDGANTILEKTFPGGSVSFVGANAPANLAGDPIRIFLGDEVDRWPLSAGTEGDPVELGTTRALTFPNRKIGLTSTPTDETSRIAAEYELSDQRRYFVPCPDCGHEQYLIWKQVKWTKDLETGKHDTSDAHYECIECKAPWSEAERHDAVQKGRWVATNEDGEPGVVGFHLNALCAPWANCSLPILADKWVRAQGKPMKLKEFVNTVLAEVYEPKTASVAKHILAGRREVYPISAEGEPMVPRMVAVLLAGVDLQDDRIEVQVVGVGRDLELWPLEYHVLDGDPSNPEVWEELWTLISQPRRLERGGYDYIRATAVDTGGHHTQQAYAWCKPRHRYKTPDGRKAYCFAIKGSSETQGDVWPRKPSIQGKQKTPLYMVRVDPIKEALYYCLQNHPPRFDLWGREVQPGVVHFPLVEGGEPYEFHDRYFEQLTAEKRVEEVNNRTHRPRMVWKLKYEGARNEALDTLVYAYAALQGLIAMGLDLDAVADSILKTLPELPPWEGELPAPIEPEDDEPEPPPPPDPTHSPPPPVPALRKRRRRRRRSTSSLLRGR